MEPIKQEENIIIKDNYRILAYLSNYLNHVPDLINQEETDENIKYGVTSEKAFGFILAAEFGLDLIDQRDDQDFFNHYFIQMIHKFDSLEHANNPY